MAKLHYKEISKAKIKQGRNVVISEAYDKDNLVGYAVSEQGILEGEGTGVFLRGGLGILDTDGLRNLYEASKTACEELDLI